jgi:AAA+ superfamily predicted ATPase
VRRTSHSKSLGQLGQALKFASCNGTVAKLAFILSLNYVVQHLDVANSVGALYLPPTRIMCEHNMLNLIDTMSPTDSSVRLRIAERLQSSFSSLARKPFEALDVDTFEDRGHCQVSWRQTPPRAETFSWAGLEHDTLVRSVSCGIADVSWQDQKFVLARFEWREGYSSTTQTWVMGPDESAIDRFAMTIYRVTNVPHKAVLVFSGGCWSEKPDLYQSIQSSFFDNLIFEPKLVDGMRQEFKAFLTMRKHYESLGLPWRRGALLIGPPGNGKTQCLRAMAHELDLPTLYVQSLKAEYEREDAMIARVFNRARQLQPCLLIFEDLDALITAKNRSVFLNQMDGFERNVGLIVVGTTNHPERLDASMLDRPSRFDRKYHFPLPSAALRARYVEIWRHKLQGRVTISAAMAQRLVDGTDGFSFAYLQELFVSALLRIADGCNPDLDQNLSECLLTLREQMKTGRDILYPTSTSTEADDGSE